MIIRLLILLKLKFHLFFIYTECIIRHLCDFLFLVQKN